MSENPAGAGPSAETVARQLTKLAVEMGPLVVFFLVNSLAGRFLEDPKQSIFWATGAFMIASPLALIASRLLLGHIATMPLVTGVFVLVFGGLTLWLHDDLFIKMKPTIVNVLFAVILFGGLATGRPFLRYVFGQAFHLTEEGWSKLTFRWAWFFLALALLNEIMWRNFSTETWAAFKVFGIMPLTMLFAMSQIGLMMRHEARAE